MTEQLDYYVIEITYLDGNTTRLPMGPAQAMRFLENLHTNKVFWGATEPQVNHGFWVNPDQIRYVRCEGGRGERANVDEAEADEEDEESADD